MPSSQIHSAAFLVFTRLRLSPAPVCPSTAIGCGQEETRMQIQEPGRRQAGGVPSLLALLCHHLSAWGFISSCSSEEARLPDATAAGLLTQCSLGEVAACRPVTASPPPTPPNCRSLRTASSETAAIVNLPKEGGLWWPGAGLSPGSPSAGAGEEKCGPRVPDP